MVKPAERPGRQFPVVYLVLAVAVVAGVGASFLLGGLPHPSTGPRTQWQLSIELPPVVWGLLLLSPLIVGWAALILRRLTGPAWKISGETKLAIPVFIALAILFVYLMGQATTGQSGTVTYGTGPSGGKVNDTNTSNVTQHVNASGGGVAGPLVVSAPSWVLLSSILAVTLFVALLAVPGILAGLVSRRPRGPVVLADLTAVRSAVAEADAAIDRGEDPRATIVQLYLRLLRAAAPKLGDVTYETPEEIRHGPLTRLGVSPPAAEALTRLFEEARYSTHPLGPEAADRCRDALRSIEADLSRVAPLSV